jgi:hypothetical protein
MMRETTENFARKIGARLRAAFDHAELERRETEERWLKDLRQYKGIYDPEVLSRLHPRRSKAFLRMTRTKVRALDARIIDLLLPGSGEANWSLEPTPSPEISPESYETVLEELAVELGRHPEPEEARAAIFEEAKRSARSMSGVIRDQLVEADYEQAARDVIHSGHLYGTGVLKGPLVSRVRGGRWIRSGSIEGDDWRLEYDRALRPHIEFVQVWDIYPDPGAKTLDEAAFVFQRHVMTRNELLALSDRPDFDGDAINKYISLAPEGDVQAKEHEDELSSMSGQTGNRNNSLDRRYELIEFWGRLSSEELAALGCEIHQSGTDSEHPANVWLLGSEVVKAVPSPLVADSWPYHFYYFEKDETSIFGEGLASVIRDSQQLLNASVRALLDNAAISAGPQIEVNQDLLLEDEDPTDVHPFRIWLRKGAAADAQNPAIRVTTLPSHTQEFMAMAEMFERFIAEISAVPSALQWDQAKGAAGTARGLSMLLGQAGSDLKDHVRLYDEGITKPLVAALYHWNMIFNPRSDIKGDLKVNAMGVASLVAKELYVEQLDIFAQTTANTLDAKYIDRPELLRRMARARDLGPGIVKTPEEIQAEQTLSGGKP